MSDFLSKKLINGIILIISIGLFVISLSQEGFCTDAECGGKGAGLYILLIGALGFYTSVAGLTWLANPAIIISWFCFKTKPKTSLIASIIAVCLSLSFLFFKEVVSDESGSPRKIIGYHIGYWLWVSCSVSMLIGNTINLILTKRQSLSSQNIFA